MSRVSPERWQEYEVNRPSNHVYAFLCFLFNVDGTYTSITKEMLSSNVFEEDGEAPPRNWFEWMYYCWDVYTWDVFRRPCTYLWRELQGNRDNETPIYGRRHLITGEYRWDDD